MTAARRKARRLIARAAAFLSVWVFLWGFCIAGLAMTRGTAGIIVLLEYLGYHPMADAYMG